MTLQWIGRVDGNISNVTFEYNPEGMGRHGERLEQKLRKL